MTLGLMKVTLLKVYYCIYLYCYCCYRVGITQTREYLFHHTTCIEMESIGRGNVSYNTNDRSFLRAKASHIQSMTTAYSSCSIFSYTDSVVKMNSFPTSISLSTTLLLTLDSYQIYYPIHMYSVNTLVHHCNDQSIGKK